MNEPVIELQNVSKRFAFTPDMPQSVLETLVSFFSRRGRNASQELWAARDVTFAVQPGQCLGIIGRNGSGKSTVLKLIARILQPTSGQIIVRGRVSALLELGAGFHLDLTGRENIYLNASVLGLSHEEIDHHFDDIVAFSELGEFIDMPVKHYSSGMYMRLGFSVAIHVHPDILIVDEILAVGDQSFQTKCMDRILEMKRHGVTILLISHNMGMMRKLCSDLVWLDQGQVRMMGPTEAVIEQYIDLMFQRVGQQIQFQNRTATFKRWGTRQIEITGVRFLNAAGEETTLFETGDPMTVELSYVAHEPILNPEFGLAIYRQDGLHVNGPNTRLAGLDLGVVEGPGLVSYCVQSLPLLPARYQLTAAIHDSYQPLAYDYHEEAYAFRVIEGGTSETNGLIVLPAVWKLGSIAHDGPLPDGENLHAHSESRQLTSEILRKASLDQKLAAPISEV
jgi:ABC-type polysaccharide/polyol phosphate transport system ATPase subunit